MGLKNYMRSSKVCIILFLIFSSFSAYAGDAPSGRIDYVIEYFPPANAMIMHGGWGPSNNWTPLNEMWKLDATGWSQMVINGSPAMSHHSMTYDSGRQVLIAVNGDGKIGLAEAIYIMQKAAGLENEQ